MTNDERATTRETRVTRPGPTAAGTTVEPVTTIRTTDRAYTTAGPDGLSVIGRIVAFILSVTGPFVEPFRGMFALDRVRADQGSVFDIAALVALFGWTLVEALVVGALRIFARRPEEI
jgi:hypothetical protein